jgi:hypothetical protein
VRPARTFSRIAFVLLLATFAACARDKAGGADNANAAQSNAPAAARPSRAQQANARSFAGSLGDNLAVEMALGREGDVLSGSYHYVGRKGKLTLEGVVGREGNFSLQEFDENGSQSGVFNGRWGEDDTGAAELTGTWTKPDGSGPLPFTLTELPVELNAGFSLSSEKIEEKNGRRHYEIDAEYPQLAGGGAHVAEFNRRARALAAGQVAEFKKGVEDWTGAPGEVGSYIDVGYRLGLGADDLVSVLFLVDTFYSGAAHPNHESAALNFDLRHGRALRLADLFKPSALYLRAVSDYCIRDLKRQMRASDMEDPSAMDADIEEGAKPDAKNFRSWLLTRRGIEFTFDPYQVGPYAAGPQRVLVPYAALKDLINPEGPAGRFVK